jgi:hypothetical protein
MRGLRLIGLFWAVVIGAVMGAGEPDAHAMVLIKSEYATHLGNSLSIEHETVDIRNLHHVKDILYRFLSPVHGFNGDFASPDYEALFRADNVPELGCLPLRKTKWVFHIQGMGRNGARISYCHPAGWHVANIFQCNIDSPHDRRLLRIGKTLRVTKIDKSAITSARCLISLVQDTYRDATYDQQTYGEIAKISRPRRHDPFISLMIGFGDLCLSFALMKVGYKCADYADDRDAFWWGGFPILVLLGAVSVWVGFHGFELLASAY